MIGNIRCTTLVRNSNPLIVVENCIFNQKWGEGERRGGGGDVKNKLVCRVHQSDQKIKQKYQSFFFSFSIICLWVFFSAF
jgi:hypothetical protein